RHDAEPAPAGEAAPEQLEHAAAVGGAVAQGGVEHGEFVPVREQRAALMRMRPLGHARQPTEEAGVGWGIVTQRQERHGADAPIGIFDSGVGGLTVARAISAQLPRESILYIGDTARSPYGPKPIADVRRYSLEVLDELVSQGVKMLVIACNTASS